MYNPMLKTRRALLGLGTIGLGFLLGATAVAIPAHGQQVSVPRSPEATGYHGLAWSINATVVRDQNGDWIPSTSGPRIVMSVRPCSPAHRAGIEPGDKLIASNGQDLGAVGEPPFDSIKAGVKYQLVVDRQGSRLEVEVTLTERPEELPEAVRTAPVGSVDDWKCPDLRDG